MKQRVSTRARIAGWRRSFRLVGRGREGWRKEKSDTGRARRLEAVLSLCAPANRTQSNSNHTTPVQREDMQDHQAKSWAWAASDSLFTIGCMNAGCCSSFYSDSLQLPECVEQGTAPGVIYCGSDFIPVAPQFIQQHVFYSQMSVVSFTLAATQPSYPVMMPATTNLYGDCDIGGVPTAAHCFGEEFQPGSFHGGVPVDSSEPQQLNRTRKRKGNSDPKQEFNVGHWSVEEHQRFEHAMDQLGAGRWTCIAQIVKTRNAVQCRSHAQKCLRAKKRRMADVASTTSAGKTLSVVNSNNNAVF